MDRKSTLNGALVLLLLGLAAATGCHPISQLSPNSAAGPNIGAFIWPVPVSPFFQEELEDQFWMQERYNRVPILGPVTNGAQIALDPPSPDEVMRALEKARPVEGGLPFLHETQRNNVSMVIEPISDYIDPPRVYPLVGPAQLHHAHYKCTIYFQETVWIGWPLPHQRRDEDTQEVVYIDHNHLHIVNGTDDGITGHYSN